MLGSPNTTPIGQFFKAVIGDGHAITVDDDGSRRTAFSASDAVLRVRPVDVKTFTVGDCESEDDVIVREMFTVLPPNVWQGADKAENSGRQIIVATLCRGEDPHEKAKFICDAIRSSMASGQCESMVGSMFLSPDGIYEKRSV